jgi:hypothetical protein
VADTTAASEPDAGPIAPEPVLGDAGPEPGVPTVLQTLRRLDSGPRGLTETGAEERQARFGTNTLPGHRGASWARVLITQALVMTLLRSGRHAADGRKPGPIGWAAAALTAVGLVLPVSPLGSLLGLTPLPPLCYLLLAAVLVLYAAGLMAVRARDERRLTDHR